MIQPRGGGFALGEVTAQEVTGDPQGREGLPYTAEWSEVGHGGREAVCLDGNFLEELSPMLWSLSEAETAGSSSGPLVEGN